MLGALLAATAGLDLGRAQLLEDPPQIVVANQSLTAQQQDHREAVTLLAHGRVLLQRGLTQEGAPRQELLAAALSRFQRACRYDPELVTYLEVAAWAEDLDRSLERTRYLALAAERQELPVEVLEQVAAALADFEQVEPAQLERAWQLYRRIQTRQGDAASILTMFQLGRLALVTERFDDAAGAFAVVQRALELDPGEGAARQVREELLQRPAAVYALFAEAYLRAGRLDEAEEAFRRADAGKPDPALLAYRLALVAHERKRPDEALRLLRGYLDAKSTTAGVAPYALLEQLVDGPAKEPVSASADSASADSAGKQLPSTTPPSPTFLEELRRRVQQDPGNALLGYYLADALRRAEQWSEAQELYQRLLTKDPALDGHQGLIDIYRRQQQAGPLLIQLATVVATVGSLEPLDDLLDSLAGDGAALDRLDQQAAAMVADSDVSLPPAGWLALALLNARADRPERALECFQRARRSPVPTTGQAAVGLAFELFQAERPLLAAQVFEQILSDKLLPDRGAEVQFYLAGAYALARDYDRALASAVRAAELDPQSARLQAREAWVLFQARRLEQARAKYLHVLDRFDADHSSLEHREALRDVRLALSAVEVELGDHAAAEEWLQQVLDEFPEDIGAYNDLGYLWADQGRHLQRSWTMIQQAVAAEPDNVAYLDSLGWVLYRLGRFEEALVPLEQAAAHGADGVILDHLGDVYLQAGQPARAVEAWRKAAAKLENDSDNERAAAIRTKIRQYTAHNGTD